MVDAIDEVDEDRTAPHGWEVEYVVSSTSFADNNNANVCKTNHPGAEAVQIESTNTGAQSAPTLVLYDTDGEEIAFYNASAWLACRRNARPPTNGGTRTGGAV